MSQEDIYFDTFHPSRSQCPSVIDEAESMIPPDPCIPKLLPKKVRWSAITTPRRNVSVDNEDSFTESPSEVTPHTLVLNDLSTRCKRHRALTLNTTASLGSLLESAQLDRHNAVHSQLGFFPEEDDMSQKYTFRCSVLRLKYSWSNAWIPEWCIVHFGLILFSTQNDPSQIRLCISLKSIVEISLTYPGRLRRFKNRQSLILIRYLDAGERRSRAVYLKVPCASQTDFILSALKNVHASVAHLSISDWLDRFVVKENVLRSLNEYKIKALQYTFSLLTQVVRLQDQACARYAFKLLNDYRLAAMTHQVPTSESDQMAAEKTQRLLRHVCFLRLCSLWRFGFLNQLRSGFNAIRFSGVGALGSSKSDVDHKAEVYVTSYRYLTLVDLHFSLSSFVGSLDRCIRFSLSQALRRLHLETCAVDPYRRSQCLLVLLKYSRYREALRLAVLATWARQTDLFERQKCALKHYLKQVNSRKLHGAAQTWHIKVLQRKYTSEALGQMVSVLQKHNQNVLMRSAISALQFWTLSVKLHAASALRLGLQQEVQRRHRQASHQRLVASRHIANIIDRHTDHLRYQALCLCKGQSPVDFLLKWCRQPELHLVPLRFPVKMRKTSFSIELKSTSSSPIGISLVLSSLVTTRLHWGFSQLASNHVAGIIYRSLARYDLLKSMTTCLEHRLDLALIKCLTLWKFLASSPKTLPHPLNNDPKINVLIRPKKRVTRFGPRQHRRRGRPGLDCVVPNPKANVVISQSSTPAVHVDVVNPIASSPPLLPSLSLPQLQNTAVCTTGPSSGPLCRASPHDFSECLNPHSRVSEGHNSGSLDFTTSRHMHLRSDLGSQFDATPRDHFSETSELNSLISPDFCQPKSSEEGIDLMAILSHWLQDQQVPSVVSPLSQSGLSRSFDELDCSQDDLPQHSLYRCQESHPQTSSSFYSTMTHFDSVSGPLRGPSGDRSSGWASNHIDLRQLHLRDSIPSSGTYHFRSQKQSLEHTLDYTESHFDSSYAGLRTLPCILLT